MKKQSSFGLTLVGLAALFSVLTACDISQTPFDANASSGSTDSRAAVTLVHVAPSGSDVTGTGFASQPYKTLAYAASKATWGNTIKLSAGTFIETEPALVALGVSIEGAGEALTILKSGGVTLPPGISASHKDYKLWHHGSLIQLISDGYNGNDGGVYYGRPENMIPSVDGNQSLSGFTIDGQNKTLKAGVWVLNRNNVTMHHVTFKNLAQRGAVFGRSDMWWYEELNHWMFNTTIYNATFINSGRDIDGETLGNLCLAGLDGANIYNIDISDDQGYGIKFIYVGHYKNVKIHNSKIRLSEADALWSEDIAIELWNLSKGNEIYNIDANTWFSIVNHRNLYDDVTTPKDNLWIHHIKMIDLDGISIKEAVEVAAPGMTVSDSYFKDKGFGMAVWMEGKNQIAIHSNIFYNENDHSNNWAAGSAVFVPDTTHNLFIYNNVFDNFGTVFHMRGTHSNVQIRNNLILNTSVMEVYSPSGGFTFKNNMKYTADGVNWKLEGGTADSSNILTNPQIMRTGARDIEYYRPINAISNIVNAGSAASLPYTGFVFGGAPDIGRWEYGYSYPTSTSVTSTTYNGTSTSSTSTTSIRKIRLQAENYHLGAGIKKASNLIYEVDGGDWIAFNNIDFGNGFKDVKISYGTGSGNNKVEFRLGSVTGTLIGSHTTTSTGGWEVFAERNLALSQAAGVQSIYLVFVGGNGVGNFDWFEFSGDFTGTPPSSTTSSTVVTSSTTSTVQTPPSTTSTSLTPQPTTTSSSSSSTSSTSSTSTTSTTILSTTYKLVNVGSNKAQRAEGWLNGSISNNDYAGLSSEKWILSAVGSYFKITNLGNGYVLNGSSSSVNNAIYTANDSNLWVINDIGGGQVSIVNKGSGKAAKSQDVWNGNPVVVGDYLSSNNLFKWKFEVVGGPVPSTTSTLASTTSSSTSSTSSTSTTSLLVSTTSTTTSTTIAGAISGTYRLINVAANKDQSAESWVGGVSSNSTYSGQNSEKWQISPVGSYYKIVNLASGHALAADGSSSVKNQAYNGADVQLWSIESIGSGQYRIVSKANGNSFRPQDVWNGNPLQLAPYNASDALTKWTLTKL